MNREFWRDFNGWLDRATLGAIFAARDRAYEQRRSLRDAETRSDVRRMIRLMDEELVTRWELATPARPSTERVQALGSRRTV
jgi:hypothetical protein